MEQYLTVGNCKPGEEKTFSLIEVYPYMHYDSNHTEDDLNRAFQFSLDPKRCSYNIHVRSKEAQEEVTNFRIGYGFENVKQLEGDVLGQVESVKHDEELGDAAPRNRVYLTKNDTLKFMMSYSSLSVRVSFSTERFEEFKLVIKKLREKRAYRNKWLSGKNYVIK